MISKNYKDQVRVDKLTLNELHKLDYLNKDKFEKFGKINVLSLIFVQLQHYISSSIINKDTKPYFKSNYFPFVNINIWPHWVLGFLSYRSLIKTEISEISFKEFTFL